MAFPEYEDLANALLCFIHKYGGANYQVRAEQTYEPLADFFGLSQSERTKPHPDGYPGPDWNIRVRWARQRLINHGLAESRGHGHWGLTPLGMRRAQYICAGQKYCPLR